MGRFSVRPSPEAARAKRERSASLRRLIGLVIAGLGGVLLVTGAWAGSQFRSVAKGAPFLDDPHGLAVAPDGTIFVGVDGRRVHALAPDGRLLQGWSLPAPAPASALRLRALDDERVEVVPASAERRWLYDRSGTLLADEPDAEAWERIGPATDRVHATPDGGEIRLTGIGLERTAPAPGGLLARNRPMPLASFGETPLVPLTSTMILGVVMIMAGVLATGSPNLEKR